MGLLGLLPDELTVKRFTADIPAAADDFGKPIGTLAHVAGSPSPARIKEIHRERISDQLTLIRYTAWVPPALDCQDGDEVTYDGRVAEHLVSIAKEWGRAAVHHQKVTFEVVQ